ncbi:MAG: trypsin-like serine protease [Anaerolineae bacterium]|nr:trypsin-like serine protease [Anaerolineae bacterium]
MGLRRSLPIVALAVVMVSLLISPAAKALDRPTTQRVMSAVVQFIAVDEGRRGVLIPKWTGSGTIVSPDGLVLTNCHVANPVSMYGGAEFEYDLLIVAITIRSDEPPRPTYIAEVVQYSPDLDLAVVRLARSIDGSAIDPGSLNLPYVPLGDSDQLEIGDTVSIFGYPGIGGETITFTSGNVSGFSSARGIQGRAWIKTDATVAGGNSGGTAVDDQGFLVGVPTKFGSGDDLRLDCRPYADTNNDGRIDENDACIPMGGFINALRPINLALPLIDAAQRGLHMQPSPTSEPSRQPASGKASVSRLIFAPAVNQYDQPITVSRSFPSGVEDIYMLFDYSGFDDGAAWQPVLVYEGETYDDVWAPASWAGGASGTSWISIHNEPLADGTYEFLINYEGMLIGSASVEVGGPVVAEPAFFDIMFEANGHTGYVLPAGGQDVRASFTYEGVSTGQEWSYVWYRDRERIEGASGEPLPGASGVGSVTLSQAGGLEPGTYRLELYLGETLAATSDFLAGGTVEQDSFFGPVTFAQGVDRRGDPVNPGTSFPYGIAELYAFFDYERMQDGWYWSRQWSLDGEPLTSMDDTWAFGESGQAFWVAISSDDALPAGQYRLELSVLGRTVREATCSIVGSGRPTPTPVPRTGDLQMYGYIVDAATGRGIPGAFVLVLQPGIYVDDFEWVEDQVYSWGEADQWGYYELVRPLVRGETYSIIVGADGYYSVAEDDVYISEGVESPVELSVALQRVR